MKSSRKVQGELSSQFLFLFVQCVRYWDYPISPILLPSKEEKKTRKNKKKTIPGVVHGVSILDLLVLLFFSNFFYLMFCHP